MYAVSSETIFINLKLAAYSLKQQEPGGLYDVTVWVELYPASTLGLMKDPWRSNYRLWLSVPVGGMTVTMMDPWVYDTVREHHVHQNLEKTRDKIISFPNRNIHVILTNSNISQ